MDIAISLLTRRLWCYFFKQQDAFYNRLTNDRPAGKTITQKLGELLPLASALM